MRSFYVLCAKELNIHHVSISPNKMPVYELTSNVNNNFLSLNLDTDMYAEINTWRYRSLYEQVWRRPRYSLL